VLAYSPAVPAATYDNHLYYGDNLDVLKQSVNSGTVDLVYLDPPFNSSRIYNVGFASAGDAAAQIQAFDTLGRGATRPVRRTSSSSTRAASPSSPLRLSPPSGPSSRRAR